MGSSKSSQTTPKPPPHNQKPQTPANPQRTPSARKRGRELPGSRIRVVLTNCKKKNELSKRRCQPSRESAVQETCAEPPIRASSVYVCLKAKVPQSGHVGTCTRSTERKEGGQSDKQQNDPTPPPTSPKTQNPQTRPPHLRIPPREKEARNHLVRRPRFQKERKKGNELKQATREREGGDTPTQPKTEPTNHNHGGRSGLQEMQINVQSQRREH